jgi:hypothetical protein
VFKTTKTRQTFLLLVRGKIGVNTLHLRGATLSYWCWQNVTTKVSNSSIYINKKKIQTFHTDMRLLYDPLPTAAVICDYHILIRMVILENTTRSLSWEGRLCKLSVRNSQSRAGKLVDNDLNRLCCRSWFKYFLFLSAV